MICDSQFVIDSCPFKPNLTLKNVVEHLPSSMSMKVDTQWISIGWLFHAISFFASIKIFKTSKKLHIYMYLLIPLLSIEMSQFMDVITAEEGKVMVQETS